MTAKYYVDYRMNGVPSMFELYLFINPLGQKCLKSEYDLLQVYQSISENVDIHILPFNNVGISEAFFKQLRMHQPDLATRNEVFQKIYLASLAYKAANMQSKKVGREFLIALQEAFSTAFEDFNRERVLDIADTVPLDMDIFLSDLDSDLVKKLYLKDQTTAHEMNVVQTPTLVIYEHQSSSAEYLCDCDINYQTIFETMNDFSERHFYRAQESHEQELKQRLTPNLKLVHNRQVK
ncbi:DsbA family protein [Aerococcaceae bacterium DSM 111020]|nr:DsbA family protein [Aerococcaceae bacterium DSM 111020]